MGFGARIAELRRNRKESLQDVADANHFGVSIASLVDEDIDAADADQELARMFRLAGKLDADERRTLDDMIRSFLRRHQERHGR